MKTLTGSIVQINISPGGVPKRPIAEAEVTPLGIRGDSWAHPEIHGGPNQALLLITTEGIGELIAQGYPVFPGALGENLTIAGLDRRQMRIGQRYRVRRSAARDHQNAQPLRHSGCLWPIHQAGRV